MKGNDSSLRRLRRYTMILLGLWLGVIAILLTYQVFLGEDPNLDQLIFWQIRFPKVWAATAMGMALAAAGLLLQTYFNNYLADPFVLGVQSGASLMVALFLVLGGANSVAGLMGAAWPGALLVMLLLWMAARRLSKTAILILGLFFSYIASSGINILLSMAPDTILRQFLLWSFGSFARFPLGVVWPWLLLLTLLSLATLWLAQPLNILQLGEMTAQSLGVNLKRLKWQILLITSLLAALATALCGPIIFLGMAAPMYARFLLKTSNHRQLLPFSMLLGALLANGAELINFALPQFNLPLNSLLGLMGIPVLFLIWRIRKV